jgi:hypothetical protein
MRLSNRMTALLALIVLATGPLCGAAPPNASWEAMKALVGDWSGVAEGRPVSVGYRLVSNGTALMETLDGGHDATMITMYTPDGATILATHYCSAGNQPRMRADASKAGRSLDFQFVDVSNAKTSSSEVMRRLVVTFVDADHFHQEWTSRGADGKEHTSLFQYTRR